jgi:ATP-dependent Zn protease
MTTQERLQKYLFPLFIIAVLIWLAAHTLGDDSSAKLPFSKALALVNEHPNTLDHVTFHPSTQEVDFRLKIGKTRKTVYPVDQSAFELQKLLDDHGIPFDAKRKGSSPWWSILTSLLPFVLLFGFWIFVMRQMQQRRARESASQETQPFG